MGPSGHFLESLGTTWKPLGDFNTAGLAEGSVCSRPQRLWRTVLNNRFFSNVHFQVMFSWVFIFRTSEILCLIFHNSVILLLDYRASLWSLTSCSFVASCLWKVLVLLCNLVRCFVWNNKLCSKLLDHEGVFIFSGCQFAADQHSLSPKAASTHLTVLNTCTLPPLLP